MRTREVLAQNGNWDTNKNYFMHLSQYFSVKISYEMMNKSIRFSSNYKAINEVQISGKLLVSI